MTVAAIRRIIAHPLISKPWFRRGVTAVFLLLVAAVLIQQARSIEWEKVASAVRDYDGATLLFALGLSAVSYLIYSCYDVLGGRYAGTQLRARALMSIGFIAYAFNQSIGALIGTVAFRFRLYSKAGVDAIGITKIISLSIATNWLGYAALAGSIFIAGGLSMPAGWDSSETFLQIVGVCMLCTALGYLAVCAFGKERQFKLADRQLKTPSLRVAAVQLVLSLLHWPAAAAIIYVLLPDQIEFVTVLGALLLTAIAVVLTHIPAGVGVLEMVFVTLLRERVAATEVLAALLVFRAVYYLLPLAAAALLFAKIETDARRFGPV